MEPSSIRRVAVVGTGTIGMSWAATFLSRGIAVTASDPAPEAEQRLRRFIDTAWPVLARLGAIAERPPHQLLVFCADATSAVTAADFVQESAPEREAVKQELLARIDAVLPPEIVIASSSSGLLISKLQGACRHPERVVIGHPFNPPHLIPLVEVVGGARTAPATIERAMAVYAAIGKR
ncbi:MAG TPA: 3-hydroxyacyl-CoA dehydrogenase NAD-binding domain-containing protein, partial [Stellaceae bacterium]|nr:3-hydroxyacyl-CoA dehydrogenase NAD-binding domain-containing protein [Stellaceae bacterium]